MDISIAVCCFYRNYLILAKKIFFSDGAQWDRELTPFFVKKMLINVGK